MKNYYLLFWTENNKRHTKRYHAWYDNFFDAMRAYKLALMTCTDVVVTKIVAKNIDTISMLEDGSPF